MFNNIFFHGAVYEIIWNNTVEPNRPYMRIRRTRIACWIPRGTNTHSEYIIIIDFPPQQWLHERASVSRYTYNAGLVSLIKVHSLLTQQIIQLSIISSNHNISSWTFHFRLPQTSNFNMPHRYKPCRTIIRLIFLWNHNLCRYFIHTLTPFSWWFLIKLVLCLCNVFDDSINHEISANLKYNNSSHKKSIGVLKLVIYTHYKARSQWPRGLRRRSAAARLLRSWVRIPPGAWMFVCCECYVLSGRGLCDELITRPEESYRLWCVVVCDREFLLIIS